MLISEKSTINILFFIALFSQFLNSKTGMIEYNFIFMFCGFLLLFIRSSLDVFVMKLIWFVLFFQLISSVFSYRIGVGNYFFSISTILFGYQLSKVEISKKFSIIYFFCLIVYFSYYIFTDSSLNTDVFFGSSRNYISVYMIWASVVLILSGVEKRIIYFCLLLSCIVCVFASGRSGIISSSLILFSYYLFDKGRFKYVYIFLFFIFIAIYIDQLSEIFDTAFSRFSGQGLNDDGRQMILQCYFDKLDFNRIIFGIDFGGDTECGVKAIGVYNLHNSYLSLSSYFGIGSLFILFLVVVATFRSLNNKNAILIVILFCLMVRASTDSILFFFSWDYLFWAIIFKLIKSDHEHILSIKQ